MKRGSISPPKPQLVPAAEDDDSERQVQVGASTSLGSFQSWLIDATHRMEKDRQERDHSNLMDKVAQPHSTQMNHTATALHSTTPSASVISPLTAVPLCVRVCQAYIGVHQRFDALLAEHNRLLSNFLSLLLAIRVKEAAQVQTFVHHLQAAVRCERIKYQLVKHEKPTLTLYVDQLNATATFAADATIDAVVEVKAVGGRVLLPHYVDPSRPEFAWQEIVTLYMPDKTADSAWRDVMLHAHFTGRFDRTAHGSAEEGEAVIRHGELNLHPIAVRLTYEGIMLIVEYFVTEQHKMSKQNASYRDTFLPLSQAVLDMDGDMGALNGGEKADREKEKQLLGISTSGGGSVPHSPKAGGDNEHRRKGMKDRMKGISHFFHRDKHHHSHHHSQHSQHGHSQSVTVGHTGELDDEMHHSRGDEDIAAATPASAPAGATIASSPTSSGMASLPRPIAPAPPHHHSHSLSTSSSGSSAITAGLSRPALSSLSAEDEKSAGLSLSMPPTPSSSMASLAGRKSSAGRTSAASSSGSGSASLTDAERDAVLQRGDTAGSTASTSGKKHSSAAAATAASPVSAAVRAVPSLGGERAQFVVLVGRQQKVQH